MIEPLGAAQEVLRPILERGEDRERLVAAKLTGLMRGYDARWRNSPYQIDAVECVMTADLYNPESGRKSRSFINAGKIDVRATETSTGRKVIFDHKSTSESITDFNSPYWRILQIEGQVSQYMLLEWLHENRVDFALWDVMRKPGISPKGLSKAESAALTEHGRYFNYKLTDDDISAFEQEQRETPIMYAQRLAHDCTFARPDWYFQRRTVPRLDADLIEYSQELWDHSQDILATRQTGRNPRNPGACFNWGAPCEYLSLCSGQASLDDPAWTRREWVHPELPILSNAAGKRGVDVLTNSRIRMFQTCRRKHQLKYELGIERLNEEEREALYFGNVFHTALEHYFRALQTLHKRNPVTVS